MLLAARCACCGRSGPSPCEGCWAALAPPVPEPDPPGLEGLVALLRYDGPARPLVAGVKYRNERLAVDWLAVALVARLDAHDVEVDLVTWVPTTDAHRVQRGFDHAEVLARAVGRRLHVPTRRLLRRGRGPTQTGRDAAARRRDPPAYGVVAGARSVARRAGRVLLLDDVVTTGATMAAAASALRGAGFAVVPVALARTPPPERAGGAGGSAALCGPGTTARRDHPRHV